MSKMTVALLSALLLLSACETMAGFGRDLKKGGSNLEDIAKASTP